MKTFRLLRADEIECRVSTVNQKGVSLLLYKDARCDMNILDEKVTPARWQRKHELINGNLFCSVGILMETVPDAEMEWVWKQDVGTESYTEKEKGQASDAFKRACFNWGIGRELYTAPFIWITNCKIEAANGKYYCKDRFFVASIGYDSKERINHLRIVNSKKATVFEWKNATISTNQIKALTDALKRNKRTPEQACKAKGVSTLDELTVDQFKDIMDQMGENA